MAYTGQEVTFTFGNDDYNISFSNNYLSNEPCLGFVLDFLNGTNELWFMPSTDAETGDMYLDVGSILNNFNDGGIEYTKTFSTTGIHDVNIKFYVNSQVTNNGTESTSIDANTLNQWLNDHNYWDWYFEEDNSDWIYCTIPFSIDIRNPVMLQKENITFNSCEQFLTFIKDCWYVQPTGRAGVGVECKLYSPDYNISFSEENWSNNSYFTMDIEAGPNGEISHWLSVNSDPETGDPDFSSFHNFARQFNNEELTFTQTFSTKGSHTIPLKIYPIEGYIIDGSNSTLVGMRDNQTVTWLENIGLELIVPENQNYWSYVELDGTTVISDPIATATATVEEGRAETSTLVYETGKSRANLIPGNTYDIVATYEQNDHYLYSTAVGELEMLKCPTTTLLTGSSSISLGESVQLSVTVTENINNTSLNRGTLTFYDGSNVIQSNVTVSGNTTSIFYTPQTTGTHNIHATFIDSGVEYNNSNSNTLSLSVNKVATSLTGPTSLTFYFGDGATISGTLTSGNTAMSSQTVKLVDYDNTVLQSTSTDSNGGYSFTYNPQNWNINGNSLKVVYDGTNTYAEAMKTIPVTLQRHSVTVTLPEMDIYADEINTIPITLEDENGNPVTSGSVGIDITLVEITNEITIDCTDTGNFYLRNGGTVQTDNGYVASTQQGGYLILDYVLQRGDTINVRLLGTSTERGIYFANAVNNQYTHWVGQYKGTIEENHNNSSVTRQSTTNLSTSSDISFTFIIDDDGYITYQNSLGADYKSQYSYTNTELEDFRFCFYNWKTNKISITECTITKG